MSKNKKIGDWGEDLAAEFLEKKGYQIKEKNFRFSRGEIDLIACKENLLVFVEVKTRSGSYFGFPEEWVDNKKEEWVIKVADHYIHEVNWSKAIRFDIIAILAGDEPEIKHFEDAFH